MSFADPRNQPSAAFIEGLRLRFPIEPEMDRVLTRKMLGRAGPGYSPLSLPTIVEGLQRLIASNVGGTFTISNARWLTGGASKIQVAFDLDWNGAADGGRCLTPMVLRMEPPESVVETSRLREFEILKTMSGVVPVPPCYWVDHEGAFLPYPALVYGFVTGVAKPTKQASTQVTGIGLNYGPDLRVKLGHQFLSQLGRIHQVPANVIGRLQHFSPATAGSNAAVVRQVNWWRRVWEEDRGEEEPLMTVAGNWLSRNAPVIDHVSIVHGDARGGNVLFNEENGQITAWLDWELAYLGDRHQDLAWSMINAFRHISENGRDELIGGFFLEAQYLEIYEQGSGLKIDRKRLAYYQVLVSFMSIAICLGTGYRVARNGKTHQDVVCAWLSMIGYGIMEQMRQTLEEYA